MSLILWNNLGTAAATVLSATSADADFPLSWLRLKQRASRWRSAVGWTVYNGFNDKLDFNRGGAKTATVATGTYTTGSSLAAAVLTALEAADATPVWACSYNTGTHKFTISSDTAFTLNLSTGSNAARGIGRDMGYDVSSDTGSATSHVADDVSYQSRHAVWVDLGAAAAIDAAILLDHNVGSARIDGNASAITTAAGTGSLTQALAGDATVLLKIFGPSTYRYWRFLLDAVEVADGFTEVGVAFVGPKLALTRGPSAQMFSRAWADWSDVARGRQGTAFANPLSRGRRWDCTYGALPDGDMVAIETAFGTARRGQPFFWQPRTSIPAETYYVFTETDLASTYVPTAGGGAWDVPLVLQELVP